MRAVSDSELAARIRRQNRDGSQRRRDKQIEQGKVQLGGLWIPATVKSKLETLAKGAGIPLSAVVEVAIDRLDPTDLSETAYGLNFTGSPAPSRISCCSPRQGGSLRTC
jgi:hypothetical protein